MYTYVTYTNTNTNTDVKNMQLNKPLHKIQINPNCKQKYGNKLVQKYKKCNMTSYSKPIVICDVIYHLSIDVLVKCNADEW